LLGALDAPFGEDFRHAEDLDFAACAAWFVDADVLADELAEVLVGRDHIGVEALVLGALGEGADDVVSLEAVFDQQRNAHGLAEALHRRDGGGEVFGHGLALGLVVGEPLMAWRGCRGIEGDGEVRGLLVVAQVEQRVGEAEER
jgi:hypothetical protein